MTLYRDAVAGLLALAAAAAAAERCPAMNGTHDGTAHPAAAGLAPRPQRTTCPAGWRCALKDSGPTGACHFEYPPGVPPHRENCYGCVGSSSPAASPQACEPNLPTVPMSDALPNVLIVGDSISHGYFPVLRARLNGSVAALQHAPSNSGALRAGVACWN
eukprot:SAG22_NODE_9168_length_605_cov_2.503953_1_plen_159_part_01